MGDIFDNDGGKNMGSFALFLTEDGLYKYDFMIGVWTKIEFEKKIWKITNGGTISHIFTRDGLYECNHDGIPIPAEPAKITDLAIDVKYGGTRIIVQTPTGAYGVGNNYYNQLCQIIKMYTVNRLRKLNIKHPIRSIACGCKSIIIDSSDGLFESTPNGVAKIDFLHEVLQLAGCDDNYIIYTPIGLFGRGPNHIGTLGMGNYLPVTHFTIIPFNAFNVISLHCDTEASFVLTPDGLYGAGNNFSSIGIETDQSYVNLFTRVPIDDEILSVHCVESNVVINTAGDTLICKRGKFVSMGKKVIEPGVARFAMTKSARS